MFTINNPTEELRPDVWDQGKIKLAVWQHEIGEQGTEHYQGYVTFKTSMRLSAVKALEGMERAHLEARRGSHQQAVAYCSKEDSRVDGPWYWPSREVVVGDGGGFGGGREGGQGARSDLAAAAAALKRKEPVWKIAEDHTTVAIKYAGGIQKVANWLSTERRSAADGFESILYLGPSGTGKSTRLREECGDEDEWFWVSPGKWFTGYRGQKGLVFDEFRDNWKPYSELLRLVDVGPLLVETKGGEVQMLATKFRWSSNVHPMEWYQNVPEVKKLAAFEGSPLARRFTRIEYMLERVVPEDRELAEDMEARERFFQLTSAPPLVQDVDGVYWDLNN